MGLLLLTWSICTKQLSGHVGVNELPLGLIDIVVVIMHGIGHTIVLGSLLHTHAVILLYIKQQNKQMNLYCI